MENYLDNIVEPIDFENEEAIEGDSVGLQSLVEIAVKLKEDYMYSGVNDAIKISIIVEQNWLIFELKKN